jgi:predicted esterase
VRPAHGATRSVVLLLPGGQVKSLQPGSPRQLAAVRLRPFAVRLHRAGSGAGLAVWTVRYRYQGWNGEQASPLADVGWALAEVRRRHGDVPVILVGHSMGGRTALRAAGDQSVRAVLGLAPWLPDGEPVDQLAGRRVLIAHGSLDRVTSPQASAAYVERARRVTDRVDFVRVRGDTHAMLLRPAAWNRVVTRFVRENNLRLAVTAGSLPPSGSRPCSWVADRDPRRPAVAGPGLPGVPQSAVAADDEQLQPPVAAGGKNGRAKQPGHRRSVPTLKVNQK